MRLLQERFEQLSAVDSEIPSEMVKAVQGQKTRGNYPIPWRPDYAMMHPIYRVS